MTKLALLFFLALPSLVPLILTSPVSASPATAGPVLMPLPAKMSSWPGSMPIDQNFRVSLAGRGDEVRIHAGALRLLNRLSAKTGIPLSPALEPDLKKATLAIDWDEDGLPVQALGEDESYQLKIEGNQARLHAQNPLGILRGLETFLQLVDTGSKGFEAPWVTIDDKPRFGWRGLLIDVSRHFMPIPVIERNLNAMAAMKLNVLHWHLSDDQGFRVESRRFPKLAGLGSDGLFYTQDQIRGVIAFARERGIRVIPEFDMPGHTGSWLVGYPELATSAGPFQIGRTWLAFDPLMDPTKESTYEFIDSFIGEMASLFPDEYFHIGGDEVNDKEWKASATIQQFMKENSLSSTPALHAYFNKRIQKTLAKYGKHMMGWDEILNPDLPRTILIQSWRGQKSLAEGAKLGFVGILSAGYYLNLHYPASEHYLTDPLEKECATLSQEEKARILGGEAAIWGEYVSPETIDSRLWPRLAAIAERFWSPQEVKDVDSMYQRMAASGDDLQGLGLTLGNYATMLRRMTGGGPIDTLQALVDVIEPTRGYSRNANNYTQQTPLNRIVDAARPESARARSFDQLAKRVVANRNPADIAEARKWLVAWKANDAALQPLIESSFLVREAAGISKDLAAVASTGMEALNAIETRRPLSSAWMTKETATLEKLKKVRELHVAIIPGVEELVNAAGKPLPGKSSARTKK